jgi:iron(III) transport system permease protein
LILLCAPPLVTVWEAFTQSAQTGLDSQAVVSLGGGFARLQARDWATLGNSALYAFGAAVLNLVVAVAFALALRGAPTWAALPGECAVMLALALPGSVIGIAILSVFYAGSWLSLGMALGRTGWILVLAYFVRNLPLAVRPVRAALQAGGSELESAAQNLGAGRLRTWLRVTLPLIAPELFAAFLICFVTGLGEFVASELLYSPGTAPVSVRINELFRNDPAPAYALALILMLICALAAGLSAWARRRWSLAEK